MSVDESSIIPQKNPTESEIRQALKMKEFRAYMEQRNLENQKLNEAKFKQMEEQSKIEKEQMALKMAKLEREKQEQDQKLQIQSKAKKQMEDQLMEKIEQIKDASLEECKKLRNEITSLQSQMS